MKTLRTLVRWLYWRTRAYEGDAVLDKGMEAIWWRAYGGDQRLRDLANATPPEERV
jgi:hypothetical protein